ncbi:TPA: Arc family DNA-binding protein [Citrobacter koseri]|nr:Arc family DNA-binding protein [Citrobacter koseri]
MSEKFPSQMQDKFTVRFPDGLRDAIAERAKRNGRSMNSEIVQILEDALTQPAVKVQSELNVDLFSGDLADDDKIIISKSQLLQKINETVQGTIDATAEHLAKATADATLKSLSEKYDFVPKNKNPT